VLHGRVAAQFAYKAVIHRVCLSTCTVNLDIPFTFHPYLMQMASMNFCLFSAYLMALISKVDSLEDALFPWLLLYVVVAQRKVL